MPIEISYIVFDLYEILEVFSTRIKYNLNIYPKLLWEKMFQLYVSKFPETFRTKSFYDKYNLYKFNINPIYKEKINNNIESFYKDNYGLSSSHIKNTLIKKIKKYNLQIYTKNITCLTHFLDAENNELIIRDLKDIGMPKYDIISLPNKINFIYNFYKINKSIIKLNYEIFDKTVLFNKEVINDLAIANIPIYKIIVFYILFKKFIQIK
jgi:hypothetical protein